MDIAANTVVWKHWLGMAERGREKTNSTGNEARRVGWTI